MMVIMKRFCCWMPVRLGSVFVGILSMIQAAIWLMISLITLKNQEDVRAFLKELADSLEIKNTHFLNFVNNPEILLIIFGAFIALYLMSCALLIAGAMLCKNKLLYPFIILDVIYILLMVLLMVLLLINFQKRNYGVGTMILYSSISIFIMAVLAYAWTCVVSLLQIICELQCEIADNRVLLHDGLRQLKNLVDYRYDTQQNNYETAESSFSWMPH